jgi:tRNA pseudouridine55 synthase
VTAAGTGAGAGKAGGSAAKNAPSGLIIVDKPSGCTSHDVVGKIRRLAGTRRVGHAGTLDPMATGVLVIGVEKATRLLGHLSLTEKEYLATIRLGQATDTGDAEGTVTAGAPAPAAASELPPGAIQAAAAALTGPIQQVPPAVSAIKVAGRRSYELARKGQAPVLPARPVMVWSFQVLSTRKVLPPVAATPQPIPPGGLLDVDVAVRCSSGTYVRALARDLGEALGVGGHLTVLRRTRVGPYGLGVARTLDKLATRLSVVPIEEAAAAAFVAWHLGEAEAAAISHGRRVPAADMPHSGQGGGPVAAFAPDGTFVALVEEENGEARPLAVFVP